MAINFEQFYRAIAAQESGNNYRAKGPWVDGNRAYGKYQIMDFNLGPWGREFIGRSIGVEEFLNSPDIQERMARGMLQKYWNQYGARGAAAAWYSGRANMHMDTRPQAGGMPSIKAYVDSVLNKAASMPSGGGSSSGGGGSSSGGGGGGGSVPKGSGETAESYGYTEALFQAVPELRNLFGQATAGGWTRDKFQAALRDTNWYKSTSESERKFLVTQYGDPATAGQMWHTAQIKVQQMGGQLGANIAWETINQFAYGIMAKGWTDEQLRVELSSYINIDRDRVGGLGGEVIQKLRKYAYEMGVPTHDSWLEEQARNVVAGKMTVEDGMSVLRANSKSMYLAWQKEIDAGQTVQDLASPYMKSMVSILEMPPGSVDMGEPAIRRALQAKDPDTGEARVIPIWQFENELRNDYRWKQTKNAQDSVMQVAHQVLADFGLKT